MTEEPMEQDEEEEDGWSDIGSNDDDQDQEEPSSSTNSTTVVLPKTLPGQAKTTHQANKAKIRRQKWVWYSRKEDALKLEFVLKFCFKNKR